MTSVPGSVGGVVLTGGTAVRLDGADKAGIELGGSTLLERSLAALADVPEVVVVGPETPTGRPVTFRREDPPGGGPAAAVLAGLTGFVRLPDLVVVLAVDMPLVSAATVARLLAAATGPRDAGADAPAPEGAVLVDDDGRQQFLCAAYRPEALTARTAVAGGGPRPGRGLSMRHLLSGLRLVEVAARGLEAADVDTWADLSRLRSARTSGAGARPEDAPEDSPADSPEDRVEG